MSTSIKSIIVIQHTSSNGCEFTSTSLDLSTGVNVKNKFGCSKDKMMNDYFEFGCWFTISVFPKLHHFSGYDNISFIVD